MDAIKEVIDNKENKSYKSFGCNSNSNNSNTKICERTFCYFCLKGSYDISIDKDKNYDDWICPYCTGDCFCSRCSRYESILKLIGIYLSLNGELEALYEYMINKSNVMNILKNYMEMRNILIFVNNSKLKPKDIIKNMFEHKDNVNNINLQKIRKELETLYKYKEGLIAIQNQYNNHFIHASSLQNFINLSKENYMGKKRNINSSFDNLLSETIDTKSG